MKILKKRVVSLLMVAILAFSLSSVSVSAATIKKPTVKSVKAKSTNSIVVKWGKVSGAKGYFVYQKQGNKSFKKVATITSGSKTSYTAKKLKANTKYSYKLKSYTVKNGKKVYSSYSNVKSAYTKSTHVHRYVDFVCNCGKTDRWGAYYYLEDWLMENGEIDGSYVEYNVYDDYYDIAYSLTYNFNNDYLYISTYWYNSYDDFVFTQIRLDNYRYFHCIGGNAYDDYITGILKAKTFTKNSPITYDDYNDSYYYLLDDSARSDVCDLLNWFDEFIYEQDLDISLYALGFESY